MFADNNDGGVRYHDGIITRVYKDGDLTMVDGTYATTEPKWHKSYCYKWTMKMEDLRVTSNVLDALQAN